MGRSLSCWIQRRRFKNAEKQPRIKDRSLTDFLTKSVFYLSFIRGCFALERNYFTNSTTPILSSALKYCSTYSTGTGPYSADKALRISCTLRLPSAKFRHSYAYSPPLPHNPS